METSHVILVRVELSSSYFVIFYQHLRVARSISLANGQVHVAQISNNEILLLSKADADNLLLQYFHCTVDFKAKTLRFNLPSDPSKAIARCLKSEVVMSSVEKTLKNRFYLDVNRVELIFGHKVGNGHSFISSS
jgi:hypothetical protein